MPDDVFDMLKHQLRTANLDGFRRFSMIFVGCPDMSRAFLEVFTAPRQGGGSSPGLVQLAAAQLWDGAARQLHVSYLEPPGFTKGLKLMSCPCPWRFHQRFHAFSTLFPYFLMVFEPVFDCF